MLVECAAPAGAEPEPTRFQLGARSVEVEEVLDRWLARDHRYFKLRGKDAAIYLIRHDVPSGHWELTQFLSTTAH
ncbi:hypothetical protein HUS23_14150 [Ectothiorhodospiraceae bacterium 2226]|nr:hypothetical protein HUS23_14150 [Ectothiorhodospiraceae bacterium 2226]